MERGHSDARMLDDAAEREMAAETLALLTERQAEFSKVERLAGLGVWHLDVQTEALRWSDGMYALFGLETRTDPPRYRELAEYLTPDSAAKLDAALKGAKAGTAFEIEIEILPANDPAGAWLLTKGEPVRDADGAIRVLRGTALDITARKRTQLALHRSEERLRQILEHSAQAFYSHTVDNEFTYVSPRMGELIDCPLEELPDTWPELLTDNPVNAQGFDLTRRAIETGEQQRPYRLELKTRSGRVVWVEIHESPVVVDGRTVAVVGALTDITERVRSERALETKVRQQMLVAALGRLALSESDLDRVLNAAASSIADGFGAGFSQVLLQDDAGNGYTLEAGVGWAEGWIGRRLGHAMDCTHTAFVLGSLEPVVVDDFVEDRRFDRSEILAEHGVASGISVLIGGVDRPLGVVGAFSTERHAFSDADVGFLEGVANTLSAAIERVNANLRLSHMAHHDALTGLPNRVLLTDRLQVALAHAARADEKFAVLYMDLDRFKGVNDVFGHAAGDAILKEVAARLNRCVRAADTISRQGGDEFLILLPDIHSEQDAARVAQKLMTALSAPFVIGGTEVLLSGSVGIACYPLNGDDAEVLMRNADAAMYAAKEHGRNTYQFYSEEMNARAAERLRLEGDLRRALQLGQMYVVYQPQVDLAAGGVSGIEALVRWEHPVHGPISPTRFIPIAEECGLIGAIGDWVLETACRQHAAWIDEGLMAGTVAVNVSAYQFRHPDFVDVTAATVARTGLDPRHLELEITESIVMHDVDEVTDKLSRLSRLGVHLAIDDFGTGYSSLSYLKQLPISRLKIDQSFVRGLPDDRGSSAIAQAIISLGRSLDLQVIAEGTETAEQEAHLRALSCHAAQGYLYAKPMPAEECERYLRSARAERGKRAVSLEGPRT